MGNSRGVKAVLSCFRCEELQVDIRRLYLRLHVFYLIFFCLKGVKIFSEAFQVV